MKTENNIRKELGERIRERRKKLGMTQAQLCQSFMTRNMLSRIETGDASPSLDTLLFIAQKLKMPPAYFLCRDSKEEAEYTKTVRIKDARRYLSTGQYKRCIDICQDLPSDDDEVSFIIVNARILAAIDSFDRGDLREALAHLEFASTALHGTVYLYGEMKAQIKLMRLLIASLSKGELPKTDDVPSGLPAFFNKDRYLYITSLSLSEGETFAKLMNDGAYKDHVIARGLLTKEKFLEARSILEKVYAEAPDSFCKYFSLCDLEVCTKSCEDYKTAYEYAQERITLHEKYQI